jgi:hypothetical protein
VPQCVRALAPIWSSSLWFIRLRRAAARRAALDLVSLRGAGLRLAMHHALHHHPMHGHRTLVGFHVSRSHRAAGFFALGCRVVVVTRTVRHWHRRWRRRLRRRGRRSLRRVVWIICCQCLSPDGHAGCGKQQRGGYHQSFHRSPLWLDRLVGRFEKKTKLRWNGSMKLAQRPHFIDRPFELCRFMFLL